MSDSVLPPAALSGPPIARRDDHAIVQFGRNRTDPYAWLKDDNWREVLRYAWSIKLTLLASALGAIEFILPLFFDDPPIARGRFAACAALVSLAAAIARLLAQTELSGKPNEE